MKIEVKVLDIIKKIAKCEDEVLAEQNWDFPLTGEPLNFSAVKLMYLFLEIEKNFGIKINEQQLHEYGFSTFNKIINAVNECLN